MYAKRSVALFDRIIQFNLEVENKEKEKTNVKKGLGNSCICRMNGNMNV